MEFEPGQQVAKGFIPLSIPEVGGNEWQYLKECLDTGWVSSAGTFVGRFEKQVAEYVGTKHAVATINGTAALHTALLVAGVQPDDEVLVSTLTFIAPVNAIRYVNAWPVLIDAEPDHWQMDTRKLREWIKTECHSVQGQLRNRSTGRRVKAIVPVHLLGHPVDLEPLVELARKYDLVIIEDATESLGAEYQGQKVGTFGDIACLSFNGNKIITTGGGGMVLTADDTWAGKARYLTTQAKDDRVESVHGEIGYNYRLTNLQAAMGCAQMEQLDKHIAAKRRIASAYTIALADISGVNPIVTAPWAGQTFWMYTVLIDPSRYGIDSRTLLRHLSELGIQSRPLWQPMHRSPAHARALATDCKVADRIWAQALSLPCSVGLTECEQNRVIEAIQSLQGTKRQVAANSM
jgi:perosamine synthetase